MRVRAALVLLVLLLAGCARPGACCNEWSLQGDDPRLFDALSGVAGVVETRHAGWGARHPVLDDLWGEYALVSVIEPDGLALSGTTPERLQLSAGAAPDADRAALRARVVAFLQETIVANESEMEAVADRLLANATPLDGGSAPHTAGATPPPGETNASYVHYFIDVPHPPRAQALLDAKPGERGVLPEESFGRDQGTVEAEGWVFVFSFPLREVDVSGDDAALRLVANGHGGLLGQLRTTEPLEEAEARARVEQILESRGAADVDASAWGLAGTTSGGPAPPGASPTPTP